MYMSRSIVIFFVIMFMVLSCQAKKTYNAQTMTLENGLQIVVIENHAAPIVSIAVAYRVGTADDPTEIVGISHFLEHMMFKGSKKYPGSQYTKLITARGGNTNAYTTFDATVYETTIGSEHLELVMDLEADRMAYLNFKPEEVIAEKQVVMEERRMRMENHPFGQAFEVLLRNLYWYHPYSVPPIGYPHHIEAYTFDNAMAHYHKWYKPNNAILIVYGDTTLNDVKAIAHKFFAPLTKGDLPKRNRQKEPDHQGIAIEITQHNKRNSNVLISYDYAAPNYRQDKKQYFALLALEQILGGNEVTDFYRYFVEEKKLALKVDVHYDGDSIDPSTLEISAVLTPDQDLKVFESALKSYCDTLIHKGITEDQLKRAKREMLNELAFVQDSFDKPLKVLTNLVLGMTLDDLEQWPDLLENVTCDDVNQILKNVFKDLRVKMVLLPPKV